MPKVTIVTPNGPVIQDLRERTGLTRKQFGAKVYLSHESIRRIEHSTPVGRLLVCRVAKALKVDVDELLDTGDESDVAA